MVNFLALMGWSPGGDREVMSLDEMVAALLCDGLQKKAAVFDTKKLEWMNGQHLSRTSAADLEPRISPALIAAGVTTAADLAARRDWYLALLDLLKVRARLLHDVVRQALPYFAGTIALRRGRRREAVEGPPRDRRASHRRARFTRRARRTGPPSQWKRACARSPNSAASPAARSSSHCAWHSLERP